MRILLKVAKLSTSKLRQKCNYRSIDILSLQFKSVLWLDLPRFTLGFLSSVWHTWHVFWPFRGIRCEILIYSTSLFIILLIITKKADTEKR